MTIPEFPRRVERDPWLIIETTGEPGAPFALIGANLCSSAIFETVRASHILTPRTRAAVREATISLGYRGDGVINSVSDIAFMLVGFALAVRLPVAVSIALAILLELAVGYMIRDDLALNIIMQIWPIEAIRTWQAGG